MRNFKSKITKSFPKLGEQNKTYEINFISDRILTLRVFMKKINDLESYWMPFTANRVLKRSKNCLFCRRYVLQKPRVTIY